MDANPPTSPDPVCQHLDPVCQELDPVCQIPTLCAHDNLADRVPRQDKLGKGGSDVGSITETFRWNPVGNQSHPVEPGPQPEASPAWRWGNPRCEA